MTTQLTLDIAPAPAPPPDDRTIITDCIRRAVRSDGTVSANDWRPLIPASVFHKHVGQTVRALVASGHLVFDGWTISDDVRGGNNGKPARRYRWSS